MKDESQRFDLICMDLLQDAMEIVPITNNNESKSKMNLKNYLVKYHHNSTCKRSRDHVKVRYIIC